MSYFAAVEERYGPEGRWSHSVMWVVQSREAADWIARQYRALGWFVEVA
jgi:hypothetical protein